MTAIEFEQRMWNKLEQEDSDKTVADSDDVPDTREEHIAPDD